MPSDFYPHPVEWTEEKVSRFWDFYARRGAGEFFSEKSSEDVSRKLRRTARPRTVVDIGCGTGRLVRDLALHGVTAIGIDSSDAVLKVARDRSAGARHTPEFHLGSVVAIPLASGTVDAVTLIEVVEHLDDATLGAALAEARRILRPGGTLMITTPNNEDLGGSTVQCPDCGCEFHAVQHVRSWTPRTLRATLLAAGFIAVRVTPTAFAEHGRFLERLVPLGYRVLGRRLPRLVAFATAARPST